MKASVRPTERLKLLNSPSFSLARMNSTMSGWSTRRMPMLAPRRVPPCLICSVAVLKMRRKETGPEATPPVEPTRLAFGAQAGEGKARAAAGLVDHGGELDGIEDLFDGVAHRQDEAGGELAQLAGGVHQGGGVGQEAPAGHQVIEPAGQVVDGEGGAFVLGFFSGDGAGHTPEQVTGRLGAAVCFFVQIAFLQHHFRIGLEPRLGRIVRHGRDHGRPLGKKESGWPPAGGKVGTLNWLLTGRAVLEPHGESPLYAFPGENKGPLPVEKKSPL